VDENVIVRILPKERADDDISRWGEIAACCFNFLPDEIIPFAQ
jgi:hypothetical protein